ncbi:MAG TPA: TonB-dependent receptor [Bryobacteraceae bacterium]|nr:TonB-dependent receptor [Bryobacteraceae bacterium]
MRKGIFCLTALFAIASSLFCQDIRTATLVGTVTDSSGGVIANVAVTVTNVDTQVVTRGLSNAEGAYYLPFLNVGNYRLSMEAPGFKRFEHSGLVLNAGENPRIDVKLEVGAVSDTVKVTAAAPLLATDTAVVGSITTAKEIHDTPIPQSKPQHFMYYQEGAQANNDGTYHILGQPEAQMSYTLDGITSKQAIGKALGDTNTLITPPVDTLQEAQVLTTGIPAEFGHAAGGAYSLTTKSGTNDLHFSAEERYINKDWLHRQPFNQGPTNTPFEYHNFDATLSGPIVIPGLYHGKNRTFFLLGYRLDYDHETNYATVSVPTIDELNGNFSFNGLGQAIYDPKSITCSAASCANGTGYTATAFPGNIIPKSRFDPVTSKFFSLNPYNTPNLAPTFTTTGPTNDYISGNIYLSDRQAYLGKIDQTISDRQKIFVRYIWNKYRVIGSRNNILFAWRDIDNTALSFGLPEPIDERNVAAGYIFTISPTLINELQLGYQRRNDSIYPATANQGWAATLGIPGVGPQTFPGLISSGSSSFTWTANPGGASRTINEDIIFADNVTKVWGLHTIKFGYQGIRQRENDITASQPSGAFTFTSGLTGAPLTPNTGNSFATLELGAVSSANFTQLLANYLPHWFMNQFYVQDDWRIRRNLTLSIGLRYSLETPANTQYGLKSAFDPNATDPVTGLKGGITHPTGTLYNTNTHNFTPRLGLAWNFRPKFVFRGSFGMFTQDLITTLAQDEYIAQAVVQQPSGNPFPAFYLSQGPGPIAYNLVSGGTALFVGTNYSSRNTSFIDSHLKNPYSMTWSGGVQYEFRPGYLAEVTYQGSAAVHLTGSTNLNTLPWSIYNSTDTNLLNAVFANSQAYLPYTQFGTISYATNPGHSTYHAMIARMQHAFGSGFSANFLFTFSKNLVGGAGSGYQYYDWRLTKALATSDQKLQFVNQLNYDVPVGRGRRFLNHGGVVNHIVGGWTFLTIQSFRSGLPVTFSSAGSPYKYLPGEGGLNIVPGQTINVPNYSIGPNMFPQSAQNPFYNINAFSYPAAFSEGNAGSGIARTGWLWWPQYSITKTWSYKEKYKVTVRMDADNLFPETRWLYTANNTVNLTSPQNFGKFPATTGYSFSNFYGTNGTLQGVLRIAF